MNRRTTARKEPNKSDCNEATHQDDFLVEMKSTPSGHLTLDLLQFPETGFVNHGNGNQGDDDEEITIFSAGATQDHWATPQVLEEDVLTEIRNRNLVPNTVRAHESFRLEPFAD